LSYAQELKMLEDRGESNILIQYHVLASNPKIRQGLYQKFLTLSLKLVEEGNYKDDQKDSLWTYYNILGDTTERGSYLYGIKNGYWKTWLYPNAKPVVIREGTYKEGKRIGVWTFRNTNDSLDNKYDYDSGKVIEYGKSDKVFTLIDKKDTITAVMDKPPVHIGGLDTLYDVLARNIRTPIEIKRNMSSEFHYKVFISFCINENGKLENYTVARGKNKACNDEALRVIKLWDDGNWIPGYYNGHTVKVMQVIPIAFDVTIIDHGPFPPPNAVILH
jgi:hypothetical protein